MNFQHDKKICLEKKDKSTAGEIDKAIKPLLEVINNEKRYYTTSSCAGRIVLIQGGKKKDKIWLYSNHDFIEDVDELWDLIENYNGKELFLKSEPMIVHVACETIENAFELVNLARNMGFKRAGIQSKRKNIVEISSSELINIPVFKEKNIITKEQLEMFVESLNKMLKETREKLSLFESHFRNHISKIE